MPIEEYCRRHTIIPLLGTPSIGETGGTVWTYERQQPKKCHVRQTTADDLVKHGTNATIRGYRLRFDSDPQLDNRSIVLFVEESIYLQIEATKVVRDGTGKPVMWVVFANENDVRQDEFNDGP